MSSISAYNGIKDTRFDNDSLEITSRYNHKPKYRTGFLGYRDLPEVIRRHVTGVQALDLGCGTGFSTKLLDDLNFQVIGADISERMLSQARIQFEDLTFMKVERAHLPFEDNYFDLVLSAFVLFDIPNMGLLCEYLKEAQRVLKPNGKFIAVTGSEFFHKNNWLTAKTDVEKNSSLSSGNLFRTYSVELDVFFHDTIYTHEDYLKAFKKAGMTFKALYQPLGKKADGIAWETEWDLPPFSVYVCDSRKD